MSTTYEFYAGRKTAGGKIEAIGPYVRRDDGYHLIPILERSRSFIDWNEFDGIRMSPEQFTDDQIDYFTTDAWNGEERYSLASYIPYRNIWS